MSVVQERYVVITCEKRNTEHILPAPDTDVLGKYVVLIDDQADWRDRAGIALDVFHNTVPVKCMEDLVCKVTDLDGSPVLEDDSWVPYSGQHLGRLERELPTSSDGPPAPPVAGEPDLLEPNL